MDYGDVIVNLLTTEMRERYNIEKAWGDGNFISLEGSENE
jgi:ribosomal silencing factor RsfS